MGLVHFEAQVLYARYLKSGMTLEQFCKFHQVPYWDFSDWINQWEKLHGAKYVEDSTKICYNVNLELSKPGTIIKGAKLTFPSGIVLNIPRINHQGIGFNGNYV